MANTFLNYTFEIFVLEKIITGQYIMGCSFSRIGKNRKTSKTIVGEMSFLKVSFEKFKNKKLFIIEEVSHSKEISIYESEIENI